MGKSKVKKIDNMDALEKLLANKTIDNYNIRVAESDESYTKADLNNAELFYYSSYENPTILLQPTFFEEIAENIKKILRFKSVIANELFLKSLEDFLNNKDYFPDETSYIQDKEADIIISEYNYDEDFIRKIAEITKNKFKLVISFFKIKPSETLFFSLIKERATVNFINDDFIMPISDEWFDTYFLIDMKHGTSYAEKIQYDKLLKHLDCLDQIMQFEHIRLTNISNTEPSYKIDTNEIYLKKAVAIAENLRLRGYEGIITIHCDSIYDICTMLNLNELENINFCCTVMIFNGAVTIGRNPQETIENETALIINARMILKNSSFTLREKIYQIHKYLEENSTPAYLQELSGYTYDLCRFFGLAPIKCYNPDCYFFYEPHNSKVVKYIPQFMHDSLKDIEEDLDYAQEWSKAFEKSNNVQDERIMVYEQYLNANSVEEIKQIFRDSIDLTTTELYWREIDQYMSELRYLISILIDISQGTEEFENKYSEYAEKFGTINSVEEAFEACEFIANVIIENKTKQVGIGISWTKRRKPEDRS